RFRLRDLDGVAIEFGRFIGRCFLALAAGRLSRPAMIDFVFGVERYSKVIKLARFAGVAHHDLTDLVGDVGATADDELVVDPKNDDGITAPSVAESAAQLVVGPHKPSLTDDRFARRDDVIQCRVERTDGHAASVESG